MTYSSQGSHRQRVLMELRPCFDGFAGIPQETRVLFSTFHQIANVDPAGLILHPSKRLARSVPRQRQRATASSFDRVGRLIISSEDDDPATPLDLLRMKTERGRETIALMASTTTGTALTPTLVDAANFVDYFWERLFEKGLDPSQIELVRNAEYRAIRPSWLGLHNIGVTGRYPKLDTQGFDVFIAHTPWPTRVSKATRLVVRYHDAIPIFHPHQIKYPAMHQAHHRRALAMNAKSAVFVCVSEASRSDLLKIVPEVEDRSTVIPTSVSPQFFPDPQADEVIHNIIRRKRQGDPEPEELNGEPFRYVLIVSTIEPRKNHVRFIDAWERMSSLDPSLHLIVVGSLGWGQGPVMKRLEEPKRSGRAFHLTKLSTEELRAVYSNAEAVVCPSVVEGFDLSGVEAMMTGTPVIASNLAVHREVYGDAAEYFDPYVVDDIGQALWNVLQGPEAPSIRARLSALGEKQSRKFTREEMTTAWADFFEDLAAERYPFPNA